MSTIESTGGLLNARELAILAAVSAGRVEMSCSCEPDLFIDGLCLSDQQTAHRLAHLGLITFAEFGTHGARVSSVLTTAGVDALAPKSAA